ncbi:MAG: hypothetical protein ABSC22_11090 [Roseiarcus sp.]|jgi:hypothetical protein
MARFVRSFVVALSIAALSPFAIAAGQGVALAQTQPAGAPAEQPLKQVALSEAQIQAYIAAQTEMAPIMAKAPQGATDQVDDKVMAQLDAIAKKYKFASFDEFDNVGANIGLVMDGVDPQTKKYVGADVIIKKQIADIQADKKMSAADQKEALAEMNDALKSVEPVTIAANIDLVVKYYDKIVAASPQSQEK